jgi:hypothetical protein
VDQLSCIFFQMDALDADRVRLTVISRDHEVPVFAQGFLVLGNLIALGEIRVEIILACKTAMGIDGAIEGKAGSDAVFNGPSVQHRKRPRLARAHGTDLVIRRRVVVYGAVAEKFCFRVELSVYFKTDDGLKIH